MTFWYILNPVKESVEFPPTEISETPVSQDTSTVAAVKPESKTSLKKQILSLKEEIEQINIADSKVRDAESRPYFIPGTIAEDVSMAGQSIQERQAKIRQLKSQHSSKQKHWLQKAAVVGGMFLMGLFATKDASGQHKSDPEKDAIGTVGQFKAEKEWLKNVISSKEYFKRLVKEFNGDKKLASAAQKERLANLSKDFVIESVDSIEKKVKPGVVGYYDPRDSTTYLAGNSDDMDTTDALHEFTHQSTNSATGMTERAKELYAQAYDSVAVGEGAYQPEKDYWIQYLKNPTELDARKKQLEMEMEKFGIKKYGEVFTKEHYKKIKKLYDEEKLGIGSQEFMMAIKPEYFVEIMNSIAMNQSVNTESSSIA